MDRAIEAGADPAQVVHVATYENIDEAGDSHTLTNLSLVIHHLSGDQEESLTTPVLVPAFMEFAWTNTIPILQGDEILTYTMTFHGQDNFDGPFSLGPPAAFHGSIEGQVFVAPQGADALEEPPKATNVHIPRGITPKQLCIDWINLKIGKGYQVQSRTNNNAWRDRDFMVWMGEAPYWRTSHLLPPPTPPELLPYVETFRILELP